MRYVSPSSFQKILGAAVIIFCLQVNFTSALAEEESAYLKSDDNVQGNSEIWKKNWDKSLKMWGKRAWSNLHGGWGVKRSISDDVDQDAIDKRSWENLRNGWGKRGNLLDDILQQESSLSRNESDYPEIEVQPYNDDEKRSWRQLNNGWGKRNKWSEFRGAWGKRRPDPAWNNLKGIWGKRDYNDNSMI